jgi:FkbM family methyltransferase
MNAPTKATNPLYRIIDRVLRATLRRLPPTTAMQRVALQWGFRYRPLPRVVRLRSGARMRYENPDLISLSVYYLGTFEPQCMPYVHWLAPRGRTMLDVGANMGLYTLEGAVAVGPSGRVIAIEAMPAHAERVRQNLALNGFQQVQVLNVAVGEAPGEVEIGLPPGGNPGMYRVGATAGAVRVPVRRIDDLVDECGLDSLDLVKMDIEGSEHRALLGAARTLERFKPAILIELNRETLESCGSSPEAVKEVLESAGYRGWVIAAAGARPIEAGDAHLCDECLFIHQSEIDVEVRRRLPGA